MLLMTYYDLILLLMMMMFWVSLQNLVEMVVVPLDGDSDEYINVLVRFHEGMTFPNAEVSRVIRVQNPYLWKSYSL